MKASVTYDNITEGAFLALNLRYNIASKHDSIQSTATSGNKSATSA